jgi:hypothetical protein
LHPLETLAFKLHPAQLFRWISYKGMRTVNIKIPELLPMFPL